MRFRSPPLYLTQLFSWMWVMPSAIEARSVELKAASITYGTTPLGQWYLEVESRTDSGEIN